MSEHRDGRSPRVLGSRRYALPDALREDYLSSYAGDRIVESMRYVRTYPTQLPVLRGRPASVPHRRPSCPTTDESGRRVGSGSFRVIVTTGLALLYLAGCLAALSLLDVIWRPSL